MKNAFIATGMLALILGFGMMLGATLFTYINNRGDLYLSPLFISSIIITIIGPIMMYIGYKYYD